MKIDLARQLRKKQILIVEAFKYKVSEIKVRKIIRLYYEGLKDDISKINAEIDKFSKILAERENTNDSFFEETKEDKVAIS